MNWTRFAAVLFALAGLGALLSAKEAPQVRALTGLEAAMLCGGVTCADDAIKTTNACKDKVNTTTTTAPNGKVIARTYTNCPDATEFDMSCPRAKAQNNKVCSKESVKCSGKEWAKADFPVPGPWAKTPNDCGVMYTKATAVVAFGYRGGAGPRRSGPRHVPAHQPVQETRYHPPGGSRLQALHAGD